MPRRAPPAPPVIVAPGPLVTDELCLTPGSVHYAQNPDMIEAMGTMRDRDEMMGREPRSPVHIEFITRMEYERRPEDQHRREVLVSLYGRHLRFEVDVQPGIPMELIHRHIVSEAAARITGDLEHELRLQIRQAERSYQYDLMRERERAYRQGGSRTMNHAWDLARCALDRVVTRNIPLKPWFKHKQFELEGWTAALIETEEQIKQEGESMQHCFANAYRNRIAKEEYVAYHISTPKGSGLPKSGFTLGFHIEKKKFRFDQVKGKKNDTHHCKNPELLAMIELVDKTLRKEKPKLNKADVTQVQIPAFV